MKLDNEGMAIAGPENDRLKLPIIDQDMYIYLPISLFISLSQPELFQALSGTTIYPSIAKIYKILNNGHTHACGYGTLSEMKTLFQPNTIWSDQVDSHLRRIVDNSKNC